MEDQGIPNRDRLEALFRQIEVERMDGVPILNPSLRVAAFGFEPWQDHALGVLLTPWFMNLVLVPLDQERFATSAPDVGEKVQIALPAGQVEFIVGHEPGFGHSLSCSLFSPVFEFADQDAAEECAKAALVEVLTDPRDETAQDADADFRAVRETRLPEPEVDQTKRTPSDVSRRDFLRGGTVEAEPRARA